MAVKLEIRCSWCKKTLSMPINEQDYEYYMKHNRFEEGSEAYHDFFDGHAWVLQQAPFCDLCKYDHSECYRD
jgi:hypothetical protein